MKYKAVIFDLDGTVLNTIGDLAAAVNYALEQYKLPTHSVEDVRRMVGNGVANLIRRATPYEIDDEKCAEILNVFKARYREHINDLTVPYEGVCEMLKALKDAGVYIGINSNKFDAALQNLCRIHFSGLYDYAVGESETTPKKPDPTAARRIMAAAGVLPAETLYVGDAPWIWTPPATPVSTPHGYRGASAVKAKWRVALFPLPSTAPQNCRRFC